ncbi:hypothetical protein TDB9533_03675 [Thalassocella blandensis]|nr:hypothetical protein TDB9533_03675 [Thalassocella blandensis]
MSRVNHLLFLAIAVISLISCGGGGGSSSPPVTSSPTPTPTVSPEGPIEDVVKSDLSKKSIFELKDIFARYNLFLYKGKTDPAVPSLENVQNILKYNFGQEQIYPPHLSPYIYSIVDRLSEQLTDETNISIDCDQGGSLTITGTLSQNLEGSMKGNVEVTMQNCAPYHSYEYFNGRVVAAFAENSYTATLFYDKTQHHNASFNSAVSGYYQLIDNEDVKGYNANLLYTFENESTQYLQDLKYRRYYDTNYGVTLDGKVHLSNTGQINVFTSKRLNSTWEPTPGEVEFKGKGNTVSTVAFENYEITKFSTDTTGDGKVDSGAFISGGLTRFMTITYNEFSLHPLENLTLPPTVYEPNIISDNYRPTTNDEIKVKSSLYHPYIDESEFEILYRWTINGVVVENNTSNTLPAGIAKRDDIVEVVGEVFDGISTIQSGSTQITIQDAPAELQVSEVPTSVNIGETLTFTATSLDPDLPSGTAPAYLYYGPKGMTIDANGTVTWTPQQSLFSNGQVNFAIAVEESNLDTVKTYTVSINDPNTRIPFALTSFPSLNRKHTLLVDNFTGDNQSEILGIDQSRNISIMQKIDSNYQLTWSYPYSLENSGELKQAHTFQLDDDEHREIILTTLHAIHVIKDLNSIAETVWKTEQDQIISSALGDIDENGIPEIALIVDKDFSSSSRILQVIELTSPATLKFEYTLTMQGNDLLFADVDGDKAIELVTNDGYVFNTSTWENEWYYGTGFGTSNIIAWDYDDDGAQEIVAYNHDFNQGLTIFSVKQRKQIYKNEELYVCNANPLTDNSSQNKMLVISRCYYGIGAYSFNGISLTEEFVISSSGDTSNIAIDNNLTEDGAANIIWTARNGYELRSSHYDSESSSYIDESIAINLNSNTKFAAGWNEDNEAIFIHSGPTSNLNKHLISVKNNRRYTISEAIEDSRSGNDVGLVVDYDRNNSSELFFSGSTNYYGDFKAIDLSDLSVIWQAGNQFYNSIIKIDSADFNGDDIDDAIYTDSASIRILDVANEISIASFTAESSIKDFAVLPQADTNAAPLIITASYDQLQVWEKTTSNYVSASSIDVSCNRIRFGNVDEDTDLELVCITSYNDYIHDLVVLEMDGLNLTEVFSVKLDNGIEIQDFVFDTRQENNQDIIAAGVVNTPYPYGDTTNICKLSPTTGGIVWTSAPLLGGIQKYSMHFRPTENDEQHRLIFSTQNTAYMVQ